MKMFTIRFICLSIIILSIGWKINGLRILGIFPLPSKSHFLPGEVLLKEMALRGHSIDVVSHYPQKKIINNYNDISLVGSLPILVNNLTFEESKRYTGFELDFVVEKLGYGVCDLLGHSVFKELMKTPKGTYDVIIIEDLQKWLDESTEGCVYMTFGSMVKIETMPEKLLKIFYETFERIAPIRVLLKIANADDLPDGLPKNVKISSWMPQIAVLKHNNTKAFITHGGLASTQEAVAFKVPMIGIPLFADQHTNIQNYVHRKIAIALAIDTLTPDSLTDAVNSILKDPAYRKNINRISDLFMDRPMSAMETAIYWIEYTARHGTVIKSPATHLNWWQLNSIDVYPFIVISFLVTIFVIMSLFISIWKFIRSRLSRNISKDKKNE